MDTKVEAVQPPRTFQKSFVLLFILVITMLTIYSVERSLYLSQTTSSQGDPRFKSFPSCKTMSTSSGPNMMSESYTEGKPGVQLESSLAFPYYHNYLPNAYIHSSNLSAYKNSVLAFVHNPKSGSSTIKVCMKRLLPQRPVLMFYKTAYKIREDLLNGDTLLQPYYMGDSTFGICDYGPSRPCSYFTMLREPYERVVSHYYFCKNGGNSHSSCNDSLEEFVLRLGSLFFHQLTARFNCHKLEKGSCPRSQVCPPSWQCNATHAGSNKVPGNQRETILQYVIDKLDTMFAVIGLLDEYELSLQLFEATFGYHFVETCRSLHQNTGTYFSSESNSSNDEKQSKRMLIGAAVKRLRENDTIRDCLREDEKIYTRAKEIFEIQKRKHLKRKPEEV